MSLAENTDSGPKSARIEVSVVGRATAFTVWIIAPPGSSRLHSERAGLRSGLRLLEFPADRPADRPLVDVQLEGDLAERAPFQPHLQDLSVPVGAVRQTRP